MKQIIKLTEEDLHKIIKESVEILLNENDRHKPGYWAERWAKQKANGTTPSGDRHRPDYFKGRADRHKPGYYKKYNLQHPERLERIGIDPDYIQRVKEFHDCDDLGDEDDVAMAQISLDPSCYDDIYEGKSGIHIDPENKGKFTATKKATGKSTEELTHSKNPLTRKRAIFAQNAKKWNHKKSVSEGIGADNPYISDKSLNAMEKAFCNYIKGSDIIAKGVKVLQGQVYPDKLYLESMYNWKGNNWFADAIIEYPDGSRHTLMKK